jgi:hypothetical protein
LVFIHEGNVLTPANQARAEELGEPLAGRRADRVDRVAIRDIRPADLLNKQASRSVGSRLKFCNSVNFLTPRPGRDASEKLPSLIAQLPGAQFRVPSITQLVRRDRMPSPTRTVFAAAALAWFSIAGCGVDTTDVPTT